MPIKVPESQLLTIPFSHLNFFQTMSSFLKTAALLLTLSFALNLNAQISAADQKGIEECYNAFMAAFDKLDATAIGPLFTENAEHISPMGEVIRGRANLVTFYTNLFAFFKSQPKPDKTETVNTAWQNRYLAADLILATYTSTDTHHFGDKVKEDKMTVAVLLRKTGGKWLAELVTLTPVMAMPQK